MAEKSVSELENSKDSEQNSKEAEQNTKESEQNSKEAEQHAKNFDRKVAELPSTPATAIRRRAGARQQSRTSFKAVSDLLAKWVAIVAAVGAGAVTFYEYRVKARGESTTRTLEYARLFETDPYASARRRIDEYWEIRITEVRQAAAVGDEALSRLVVEHILASERLRYDTLDIVRFFDYFRACICARTCDARTGNAFLGKDAFDFMGLNYPFIARQREVLKDPLFGRGVVDLGKAYKKKTDPTEDGTCKDMSAT
jgi:hypothetical protein